MMAREGDEVVPMVQLLLGEPAPVNGRMRSPDTTGFGAELMSRWCARSATDFQLSRAAAARSAARLTSSGWRLGTAAMAPFDSRVSGAPA
jgi:hypothetical protein